MRQGAVLAGVVAAFGVLAPCAAAATVETGDFSGELEINAPDGEANDLSLATSKNDLATVDVTEGGGAPLVAGEGCTETKMGVRCEVEGLRIVFVQLGDENDRLDGSELQGDVQITAGLGEGNDEMLGPPSVACVDAGEGDDEVTLIAPSEACSIDGEEGDDTLRSSGGRNYLYGGSGSDRLSGAGGVDNIDAGEGADEIAARGGDDFIDDGDG
ncbi:MAG TPA: hypothetical protein VD766_02480, partial [Solirubrobacterales bacterium]|nr:hypothetical protein [Solirubrobacterales bacterium]